MDNHASEQKFNDFIEDLSIPQLNDEEQSFLKEDLTINELKEALTSFADNKSPEEDGFTKECYQTFFFTFLARTFLILIMRLPQRFIIYIPETRNNNTHPKRR